MNHYIPLEHLKADIGVTDTTEDAELFRYIEAASREIDAHAGRRFFVQTATKYVTPNSAGMVLFDDDLLSVSALTTDSETDGTYDGETWAQDTDFWLVPYNSFPKYAAELTFEGSYTFANLRRNVKIVGEWGYGTGLTATPYTTLSATVSGSHNPTTTTLTASAADVILAGQTLRVGSEQMFVESVNGAACTVKRGVNGSTAASAANADPIAVYEYPRMVSRACAILASCYFKERQLSPGMQQERIGDYFYSRAQQEFRTAMGHQLAPFTRMEAA